MEMVDRTLFEQLRGAPIAVHGVAGIDVPCTETFDAARLCRNPLVSVALITYNHEKYLRRCLESVVAQRTDFEFEVVVGEDCSTDSTREICFEFQRRYPERLRVLWWTENVHTKGGNGRRTFARCRGEYLAMLEGDDYWTDPLKLQKQIDLMRRNPSVAQCFCGVDFLEENSGRVDRFEAVRAPRSEVMASMEFKRRFLFGRGDQGIYLQCMHTSGYMVRRAVFEQAAARFGDISSWRLRLADFRWYISAADFGDVGFVREPCSVYRMNDGGAVRQGVGRMMLDGDIVKIYFAMAYGGYSFEEALRRFGLRVAAHYAKIALGESPEGQRKIAAGIDASPVMKRFFGLAGNRMLYCKLRAGALSKRNWKLVRFWVSLFSHLRRVPRKGL